MTGFIKTSFLKKLSGSKKEALQKPVLIRISIQTPSQTLKFTLIDIGTELFIAQFDRYCHFCIELLPPSSNVYFSRISFSSHS